MKKTITIIVVIIILGVLVYLMGQMTPQQDDLAIIRDAWLGEGSALCRFVDPEQGTEEEISMYFKRGHIKMIAEAMPGVYGYALVKDGMIYTWDDEVGIKFPLPEGEMEEIPLFAHLDDEKEFASAVKKYQISCEKKPLEAGFFDLPEDIEFQDYMDMMYDFMPQETDELDWEDYDFDLEDFDFTE